MREVAESLVFDLAVFSVGATQEVGLVDLVLVSPCCSGYVHSAASACHALIVAVYPEVSREIQIISGYKLHS